MIQRVKVILDRAGVQYAVIGAIAMAARGFPRFTLDFDCLTTDKRVLDPDLWQELARDGIAVDVRKGESDDPLAGVVRIGDPAEIDIVLGKWKWQQGAVERAETLEIAGTTLPVATTSDLILLKLDAGGIKSRLDIMSLLEVGSREQLIAEVEVKLDDLPSTAQRDARNLWSEILSAA